MTACDSLMFIAFGVKLCYVNCVMFVCYVQDESFGQNGFQAMPVPDERCSADCLFTNC